MNRLEFARKQGAAGGLTFVAAIVLALLAVSAWSALNPKSSVYPTTYDEVHPDCGNGGQVKIYKGVEVCA